MKIGLTLPNRGVLFVVTTAAQMLEMAEIADRSGQFHSVWVGDSLFGKPRMESITLLSAIAESQRFLELYYTPELFPREEVLSWVATGSPEQCVAHLKEYEPIGFDEVTLRITAWDQLGQLKRVMDEVLPHFEGARREQR